MSCLFVYVLPHILQISFGRYDVPSTAFHGSLVGDDGTLVGDAEDWGVIVASVAERELVIDAAAAREGEVGFVFAQRHEWLWSFSACFALAGSPIFAGDEVDGEAAPWAAGAAGVVDVERGGAVVQGHEVSSGAGVDSESSPWASGALGVVDVQEDPVAGNLEDARAVAILHREEGFVSGKAFRGFDGHAGDGVQGVRYGGEFDRCEGRFGTTVDGDCGVYGHAVAPVHGEERVALVLNEDIDDAGGIGAGGVALRPKERRAPVVLERNFNGDIAVGHRSSILVDSGGVVEARGGLPHRQGCGQGDGREE